jgi:glycosyltransferase involved in cell wall biosynthesis
VKIKVVFISDTSGNPDEGMKIVSRELEKAMLNSKSIEILRLSTREVLKRRKNLRDIDILHFLGGPTYKTFIQAFLLKNIVNRKSKTIISFIHPDWDFRSKLLVRLFPPNLILAQTSSWKARIEKYYKNVRVILLSGYNPRKFSGITESQKSKLRDSLGFAPDELVVLHVGHLNKGRNLGLMKELAQIKNVTPIVIGSSTVDPDMSLMKELSSTGVTILRGYINDIEKYYQVSDYYLFPTRDSGYAIQCPLSVLEAMACGIPVISSRFGILPDYFKDSKDGILYLNDPGELSEIVSNKLLPEGVVSQNLLELFKWENIAEQVSDLYLNEEVWRNS